MRRLVVVVAIAVLAPGGGTALAGTSASAYDETAGVHDVLGGAGVVALGGGGGGSATPPAGPDGSPAATARAAVPQRPVPPERLASATPAPPFTGRDLGYLAMAAAALGVCGVLLVGGGIVQRRIDPERYDAL